MFSTIKSEWVWGKIFKINLFEWSLFFRKMFLVKTFYCCLVRSVEGSCPSLFALLCFCGLKDETQDERALAALLHSTASSSCGQAQTPALCFLLLSTALLWRTILDFSGNLCSKIHYLTVFPVNTCSEVWGFELRIFCSSVLGEKNFRPRVLWLRDF